MQRKTIPKLIKQNVQSLLIFANRTFKWGKEEKERQREKAK